MQRGNTKSRVPSQGRLPITCASAKKPTINPLNIKWKIHNKLSENGKKMNRFTLEITEYLQSEGRARVFKKKIKCIKLCKT